MAEKRGQKAWSEGVAERRGPKTCLPESRTWNQLTPCSLQPGPLAFSCMTVTLHTGEALVPCEFGESQGLHQRCDLQHLSHRLPMASGLSQRHAHGVGVGCNVQSK